MQRSSKSIAKAARHEDTQTTELFEVPNGESRRAARRRSQVHDPVQSRDQIARPQDPKKATSPQDPRKVAVVRRPRRKKRRGRSALRPVASALQQQNPDWEASHREARIEGRRRAAERELNIPNDLPSAAKALVGARPGTERHGFLVEKVALLAAKGLASQNAEFGHRHQNPQPGREVVFKLCDDCYIIEGLGESGKLKRKTSKRKGIEGLDAMADLVNNPWKPLAMVDLIEPEKPWKLEKGTPQLAIDEETRMDVLRTLNELHALRGEYERLQQRPYTPRPYASAPFAEVKPVKIAHEEQKASADNVELYIIAERIKFLEKYIQDAMAPDGRFRLFDNHLRKRMRACIRGRIKRICADLEERSPPCPRLAEYLQRCIRSRGWTYVYEPLGEPRAQ
jgi:hypothetical protein